MRIWQHFTTWAALVNGSNASLIMSSKYSAVHTHNHNVNVLSLLQIMMRRFHSLPKECKSRSPLPCRYGVCVDFKLLKKHQYREQAVQQRAFFVSVQCTTKAFAKWHSSLERRHLVSGHEEEEQDYNKAVRPKPGSG